ncbi:MAG: hypothetical protein HZB18_00860 [Chloroflexi bacterium]|nr:hypothetical protein [Chloroflexota bacterium]
MRNKFSILIVIVLFIVGALIPQSSVSAASCYASTCYKKNPATYTNSSGFICSHSTFTYTVAGSYQQSGTNGTVKVELRYSNPSDPDNGGGCQSNWSRATVMVANSSTVQLFAKAFKTSTPSNKHSRYIWATPTLGAGASVFSYMIDGSVTVTAVAGISASVCSGNNNTGEPCTYNPSASYSG